MKSFEIYVKDRALAHNTAELLLETIYEAFEIPANFDSINTTF